jgi:hypothetical protein
VSLKFNTGKGGAICDGCYNMVVDGTRVLRRHRNIQAPRAPLHFCDGGCLLRHIENERGMHRARTIELVREAERLVLLGRVATRMDKDLLFASALIEEVVHRLRSEEVRLAGEHNIWIPWAERFPVVPVAEEPQ